jgi:hypothetical protein
MLASVTIIAVGLGMVGYVWRDLANAPNIKMQPDWALEFFLTGSGLIGAGLLTPFKLQLIGAALGVFIPLVTLFALALVSEHH